MQLTNHTHQNPTSFLLMGIPGLESSHFWIAFPFCSMYALAVLGNMAVLVVVHSEPALHQPMYLFLCMLSTVDLVLCTSTIPKLLALFWANAAEITFGACAAQMFFIHGFSAVESGILLAMAFDRYLAICKPLHHGSLLPPQSVGKLGAAAVIRGLGLMTPLTCLLARLSYCSRVVAHSYCEHMAVVKLACGGTQPNNIYGITAATLVVGTDSICITVSYALIFRAVLGLSSKEARAKTFGTCGSHLGVVLLFYTPGLFSFYTQRFGQHVPRHIHILLADLYLIVPSMLNPIIYGMKTKQIRDGALRLLKRSPAPS
ncbi:putative olfactory receptor 52P1 [Tupaia chinensis]|uniref:Olfactory receptor n=1 Tax=Tupaia chinensis TaxID=246437 RepID=L9LA11_TUPCH|nr:putative olfactory receptor 52P1 [Tupaia chinensis]ELW71811.1 Putative olfactory receptor 52P1 [Tupaia chinensis]